MPTFSAETFIARPVAEVYGFVANPENQSRWLLSVAEMRRLEGQRGGVGSRYAQRIREGGELADYELEVTAVEPVARFAYTSRGASGQGPPVGVEYRFTEAGGGTQVWLGFSVRMGPVLRLFWPLAFALRRGGRRQVEVVLGRLKSGVGGRAEPPGRSARRASSLERCCGSAGLFRGCWAARPGRGRWSIDWRKCRNWIRTSSSNLSPNCSSHSGTP